MTTETVYELPLKNNAQSLEITLGQTVYNLTVKWNYVSSNWVADIADENQAAIVSGIPLITGADLLAQYAYLNFGGKLIAQTDSMPDVVPAYGNLGTSSHVYFVVSQ